MWDNKKSSLVAKLISRYWYCPENGNSKLYHAMLSKSLVIQYLCFLFQAQVLQKTDIYPYQQSEKSRSLSTEPWIDQFILILFSSFRLREECWYSQSCNERLKVCAAHLPRGSVGGVPHKKSLSCERSIFRLDASANQCDHVSPPLYRPAYNPLLP
jgi:hypothetical protein